MKIEKAIKIMKILVLIAGIIFLFVYSSFKTNDCEICFDKKSGMKNFILDYNSKCLSNKGKQENIYLENITNNKPRNSYKENPQ